jgi:hypothetical protein
MHIPAEFQVSGRLRTAAFIFFSSAKYSRFSLFASRFNF